MNQGMSSFDTAFLKQVHQDELEFGLPLSVEKMEIKVLARDVSRLGHFFELFPGHLFDQGVFCVSLFWAELKQFQYSVSLEGVWNTFADSLLPSFVINFGISKPINEDLGRLMIFSILVEKRVLFTYVSLALEHRLKLVNAFQVNTAVELEAV